MESGIRRLLRHLLHLFQPRELFQRIFSTPERDTLHKKTLSFQINNPFEIILALGFWSKGGRYPASKWRLEIKPSKWKTMLRWLVQITAFFKSESSSLSKQLADGRAMFVDFITSPLIKMTYNYKNRFILWPWSWETGSLRIFWRE